MGRWSSGWYRAGNMPESLLETSLHGDADEAMIRRVQIEAQYRAAAVFVQLQVRTDLLKT